MTPLVSVIIINWNGRLYLEACLTALMAQSYPNFETILVDNGSQDGSVAYVQQQFPQVQIIALPHNVGFAAGNNTGIRQARGRYIATLNNDTQVEPNWLTELVAALEADPTLGAVATKMLFYDRRDRINSAGIAIDRAGIAWDRLGGQPDRAGQQPTAVFGASAGAAVYRKRMLDEIGLFDEDFFAYLEDVDLAWRAQWAGWSCLYVPTAVVYHHHSATSKEGSPFKNRLLGRNKQWLIWKNYPAAALLRYLPLIWLYDWGSVLVALLQRGDRSPLQGRLQALRHIGPIWRKRQHIQRTRRIETAVLLAKMEPVQSPLQVARRYQHL